MMAWAEALEAYEASLRHHQELADTGSLEGPNPWPPVELPVGPVPEDLRERAADLVARSNRIVDDMAAKMADIPPRKSSRYANHVTRDLPRWTKTL